MSFSDLPVLWRIGLIAAIPFAVWSYINRNEYIPQIAAGLKYEVVVNRITGETCIDFKGSPVSEKLKEFQCQ